MLGVYRDFMEGWMAMPVITGQKTESEKFAGALRTYAIEALMTDGQALQAGTSHNLGQHFARVFDIKFLDDDGQQKYAWQTSWGVSTRLIGALVMVHGDERGLASPPRIALIQVVIVPILPKASREQVLAEAGLLRDELGQAFRVRLDDRAEQSPGWKYNEWELRGVPLRIEIGPRDIAAGTVTVVRRDNGLKQSVARGVLSATISTELESIQQGMYDRALAYRESRTWDIGSQAELEAMGAAGGGFARAGWCGSAECEATIKARTGATIRVLAADSPAGRTCLCCGGPATQVAYFARAY
jgi:prolyl-tRNA synthetase